MKQATILRQPSTDQGTFGKLYTEGFSCSTLELPWRDNKRGLSCIPIGEYLCVWHKSPSKGWVYHITGTEPRADILIHSANFAGDKTLGWQSHLEGCIALGYRTGTLQNKFGNPQKALLVSKPACNAFFYVMDKEPFKLIIRSIENA